MKETLVKQKKKKYIEIETDEIEEFTIYETADGKKFKDLKEAFVHENNLRLMNIKKINFWFPMVDDVWYKAKDEEELNFLIDCLSTNYGGRRYGVTRLKPGEWFTVVSRDRDGQGPCDHFLPLSKLEHDYSELVKLLKDRS